MSYYVYPIHSIGFCVNSYNWQLISRLTLLPSKNVDQLRIDLMLFYFYSYKSSWSWLCFKFCSFQEENCSTFKMWFKTCLFSALILGVYSASPGVAIYLLNSKYDDCHHWKYFHSFMYSTDIHFVYFYNSFLMIFLNRWACK